MQVGKDLENLAADKAGRQHDEDDGDVLLLKRLCANDGIDSSQPHTVPNAESEAT